MLSCAHAHVEQAILCAVHAVSGADKWNQTVHTYTTHCADRQEESDCLIVFGANKKTLRST